ncbi:MAG TPA: 4Fe-4S cluster-binding domain-containing protein [Patescibacteria group bacterium]|nr:4Fe-4S cluster-binding domain-containing protein [Patescibacteria group bacterium]
MKERSENIFIRAQELRDRLSNAYPIDYSKNDYPLSVAYFWPTKYCPIGCEHCMFASPKPRNVDSNMILNESAVSNFIEITNQSKLDALVISGGGEPMMEFPTILRLIKEANYRYFEIITGGNWLANEEVMLRGLSQMQAALTEKQQGGDKIDFSIRLSVDNYHQAVVKPEWIKRLVDVLREDAALPVDERRYPDLKLFFRTLLIEDDTVERLADLLGASLTDAQGYVRELVFSDDKISGIEKLKVFYKDMRFVGLGKNVEPDKLTEFDTYFDSYSNKTGDVRLGMTYLNPDSKGEALEGINVFVTYEGRMMPYGGVSDISTNIYSETYEQFLTKLLGDVISRTLLFKGLDHIRKIAEEIDPRVLDRIRKKNWIASVADESLDTAEKRLYVTLRLLQIDVSDGIIELESLPAYVQELIARTPEDLRREYGEHVNSASYVEHTYGNEGVTIINNVK